ncbi:MAG: DnaD domain protein [Dehalococcoidales bacterium]|nr:MAG: DnaD domain protein [Dehalococcoidales bacterium]
MSEFNGFPARMEFTPVPNLFLSSLMPQISDITELKVTLHLFAALYRKRGYPRFVTYDELLSDAGLVANLGQEGKPAVELRRGLDMAIERGTVLRLSLSRDSKPEEVYFLNSESDRRAATRIQNGEFAINGLKAARPTAETGLEETPNIFTLYEQNIGMLTPMIAEELREAEKLYPEAWIKDAIGEAVNLNKRSWRYIARILERWANEGRSNETSRRGAGQANSDKYNKQKYGHMFQR